MSLGGGVVTPPCKLVNNTRNTSQNMENTNGHLLKVDDLKTYFPIKKVVGWGLLPHQNM